MMRLSVPNTQLPTAGTPAQHAQTSLSPFSGGAVTLQGHQHLPHLVPTITPVQQQHQQQRLQQRQNPMQVSSTRSDSLTKRSRGEGEAREEQSSRSHHHHHHFSIGLRQEQQQQQQNEPHDCYHALPASYHNHNRPLVVASSTPPSIPAMQGTVTKKSRSNYYTRPTPTPKSASLLSAMGTLAAPPPTTSFFESSCSSSSSSTNNTLRVPFRRQLSGSRIEGFLTFGGAPTAGSSLLLFHPSNNNNTNSSQQDFMMDTDPSSSNRPRSMSF